MDETEKPWTPKIGDRVTLRADADEDWEREDGVVEGVTPMPWGVSFMVRVEPHDDADDGLREVPLDQIEGRRVMDDTRTVTAEPYDARHCPRCDTWVYVADGPFAEGDRTKTLADTNHWAREHADEESYGTSASGARVMTYPYFPYNEESVEAIVEEG